MAIKLGSAYGKVGLDISGLLKGVKQGKSSLGSLQEVGMKVGQGLQNAGRAMTLGLTLPIAALGAASIELASDFEETKNKSLVVFGEMSDSIIQSSNEAARALGVSKTQYLDYASTVGAALTAGGLGVKEATELSAQAVKHFADLASFHNSRVEDAAAAWNSAIRGQFEPIQKFFPFITNQYLITYGTANDMLDENTKVLTANQRAVILNAIALDSELNPALNDFAETSAGLANQQRIVKAQFEDMLVTLGQNLLPIALKFATALNGMLEKFSNMSPVMQKAVIGFAGFLAILGPVIAGIGTLITSVTTIAGFAGSLTGITISFSGVAAAIGSAGAALGAFLLSAAAIILPILLIIATIGALVWAFKNDFGGIATTAKQLWALMKIGFKAMWADIKKGTKEGLASISEKWNEWTENNKDTFQRWGEWIRDAWQRLLTYFGEVRNRLAETFQNVDWAQIGKNILVGLINGILGGIPALVAAAIAAAKAFMSAFDNQMDINSPSGEMNKRGQSSWAGYIQGLQDANANEMAQAISRPSLQGAASNQQSITNNFSSGLTMREVRAMFAANNDELLRSLNQSLEF